MRYTPPTPGKYYGGGPKGKGMTVYTVFAVFQARPGLAFGARTRTYITYQNENMWDPKTVRLIFAKEFIDFSRPVANPLK